jgi:hypothetical protein
MSPIGLAFKTEAPRAEPLDNPPRGHSQAIAGVCVPVNFKASHAQPTQM